MDVKHADRPATSSSSSSRHSSRLRSGESIIDVMNCDDFNPFTCILLIFCNTAVSVTISISVSVSASLSRLNKLVRSTPTSQKRGVKIGKKIGCEIVKGSVNARAPIIFFVFKAREKSYIRPKQPRRWIPHVVSSRVLNRVRIKHLK